MSAFATTAKDHRFFSSMSVIAAVVIIAGFINTYAPKLITNNQPVPTIIHVHALVFTGWLLLFILQAYLAANKKLALHMKLGNRGILFSLIMLVTGMLAAVDAAKHGHKGIPGVMFSYEGGFLLLNMVSIVVFTILVLLGWKYRNKAQYHKRFMLMATVGGLMPPGISRLPFTEGSSAAIAAVVFLFLAIGPLYDLITRRKIHIAYLPSSLLTLLILPPVIEGIADTAFWHSITAWLVKV